MARDSELRRYQKLAGLLADALWQYADPEFYHAISFVADRPAGGFADDCGRTTHPHYDRAMPGKLARQTLKEAERRFGELTIVSKREDD